MTIYFTEEGKDNKSIPLLIDPMTIAPNNAAQALPRPPNKLVPPITAAAMEFNNTLPPPDP